MKDPIKWKKHLEACKKWRDNNRERFREISLAYAKRKKASNPEKYLELMRTRAKQYRNKDLEKARLKDKLNSRSYRLMNKEKYNLWQREYRRKNREQFQRYYEKNKVKANKSYKLRLLRKYGLTPEIYQQMLLKQEGKCAICKDLLKKPCIDHCHTTGKVRGLLCNNCNFALGYIEKGLKKIPNLYEVITEYLK
jgi:hypothetical protein